MTFRSYLVIFGDRNILLEKEVQRQDETVLPWVACRDTRDCIKEYRPDLPEHVVRTILHSIAEEFEVLGKFCTFHLRTGWILRVALRTFRMARWFE